MLTLGSASAMILFKFVLTFLFLCISLYIFYQLTNFYEEFCRDFDCIEPIYRPVGGKLNVNDTASSILNTVYIHIFNFSHQSF